MEANGTRAIRWARWISIAKLRKGAGFPTVAVAQAWLDRADCAAVLEGQARHAFVRGVRHKPSPGMMMMRAGARGSDALPLSGCTSNCRPPWTQFDEAVRLARDFPDTTIVLNHAGFPRQRPLQGGVPQ